MEVAFSDAYARILKATGCDGQAELAKELAISPAVISNSRRRGEIRPEILLALLERWGLNPKWIRTGKGRPYFCASPIQIAQMAGRGLFPAEEEQSSLLRKQHFQTSRSWPALSCSVPILIVDGAFGSRSTRIGS